MADQAPRPCPLRVPELRQRRPDSGRAGGRRPSPVGREAGLVRGAINGAATKVKSLAMPMGGHARVGLGDDPKGGGGKATIADLVAQMVRLSHDLGREVATPAEAREILGLDGP